MKIKKRLDQLVQELAPHYSRRQIQSFIMQGMIFVDGNKVTKPGMQFNVDTPIQLKIDIPKYVSRAGLKLEHALKEFGIDVGGLVVLDAGLSTGGFTDCLLQHGAKHLYGVDVGFNQAHEKIRQDDRVSVMEQTNLRTLEKLPELVDLVTLDLSFISILKVMEAVTNLLKKDGQLVTLIKPQFEAERHEVGRGGIIKDPEIHEKVVHKVTSGIKDYGFELIGVTESPITGAEGNKEFLAHFKRAPSSTLTLRSG